jgi:hypothetical protein
MTRAALVLVIPLIVVLGGCGGSTKTMTQTVTSSPSVSASSTPTSTTTPTGPQPCPSFSSVKAIPSGLKCTGSNGLLLTLDHQSDVLHLKTLSARVASVSTTDTLSGSVSSKTAQGRFVVISIEITNNANSPETFGSVSSQQTALLGGGNRTYSEDFDAENGPDQHSCVSNDNPIQPGAHLQCDVVYDVPTPAVDRAHTWLWSHRRQLR